MSNSVVLKFWRSQNKQNAYIVCSFHISYFIHKYLGNVSNLLSYILYILYCTVHEAYLKIYLRDIVTRFLASGFFHEFSSPGPLIISIALSRFLLSIFFKA
jgi:hypothetical protein